MDDEWYLDPQLRSHVGFVAATLLDEALRMLAEYESPNRRRQPRNGGASPQPQRGTGACGMTSAPACELWSAMRVPHST